MKSVLQWIIVSVVSLNETLNSISMKWTSLISCQSRSNLSVIETVSLSTQFPLSGALCWFFFLFFLCAANHATSFWHLTRLTVQLFIMSHAFLLFFNFFGCQESRDWCVPERAPLCLWWAKSVQMKGLLKIFVWRVKSLLGGKYVHGNWKDGRSNSKCLFFYTLCAAS